MSAPVRLPFAIRAVNRAGGVLRAAGVPLVSLDERSLLDAASRATGLDDFGDEFFREALRRLLASFEREAAMTLMGRIVARRDLLRLLENRLRMVDVRKRNPEIAAGEVRAPIFVIGLPRTGTTILHELLAQDPANRVLMTWEVMHPFPPPERATYETDPRIAAVEKHFSGVDRILPHFKKMHPMGARLPQECVALTAHDFASMVFSTTHFLPSYQVWLDTTDLRPVYESHRRWLQVFQWHCGAERWVLKSPGHLWALDALLAIYPDARIVQTHRDPLKVLASLASLEDVLRRMASDVVDIAALGREWSERLADGLARAMRVRDEARLGGDRAVDVSFGEFMKDEVGMVRRIYEQFGIPFTAEAEARMRRFLAENPADKHGGHRYTLAAAKLSEATERSLFAAYQERFGIASERVD